MAGMGLSGGFAAGAGAEGLDELLKRLFVEGTEKRRAAQEDQRIQQENRRLSMADADRDAMRQDMAKTRAIQGAGKISGQLKIGQTIAPPTVQALQAGEMGDLVQHDAADLPSTALSGVAAAGAKAPIMGQLRMSAAGRPERDTFTGTADQLAAEQARTDTLGAREQARLDRIAAARQAAIDRSELAGQNAESRAEIARIAASGRGANADLQREILQGKIDAAKEKETDKQKTADTARNAALASIDDTAGALDELIDANGQLKPGVSGATGIDAIRSYIPGTSAADAKARIDRLQSRLTIDLLGEMKRQSRTGASGFGALSEKELGVLQNAAARLGQSQSDESFRQALVDVRKQLAGMRQRAAGPSAGAPAAGAAPAAKETPEQRLARLLGGG